MFGYHGRYLRIDLTQGSSSWMPLPEDVLRRFVGGVGLATYLLHREAPRGVDPLAPEAPLIFCLSPLVGTPLTTSAKFAVVAKSPLTDRLNDALSSSHFAIAAAKDLSQRSFGPATAKYRELGTVANLLTFNRFAALPTRNFQQGSFEGAANLSGEELNAAHRVARRSCAACTIGCEHIYAGPAGEVRLEYETLFALGPLCGISDRDAVLHAAKLCDEYGLDTISAGATIAFAMECAERGLIHEAD